MYLESGTIIINKIIQKNILKLKWEVTKKHIFPLSTVTLLSKPAALSKSGCQFDSQSAIAIEFLPEAWPPGSQWDANFKYFLIQNKEKERKNCKPVSKSCLFLSHWVVVMNISTHLPNSWSQPKGIHLPESDYTYDVSVEELFYFGNLKRAKRKGGTISFHGTLCNIVGEPVKLTRNQSSSR